MGLEFLAKIHSDLLLAMQQSDGPFPVVRSSDQIETKLLSRDEIFALSKQESTKLLQLERRSGERRWRER